MKIYEDGKALLTITATCSYSSTIFGLYKFLLLQELKISESKMQKQMLVPGCLLDNFFYQ